jgi:Chalcone isomerase-like
MSDSTRSCGTDGEARWRSALVALTLSLVFMMKPVHASAVNAPPLPPQVALLAPNLKAQGGGELTFFGISIYDGYYWSPNRGWSPDGPFALDLHYHRALDGVKIAERSVGEIAKMGYGNAEQCSRWGEEMKRLFPDVRRGDRLTGVNLPGGVVRFFHNGKPIGDITDPGFARAFFGIWLDPKTSQLDFRRLLLGESP